MSVVVFADEWDPHADKVCAQLVGLGESPHRFNLDVASLQRTTFQLSADSLIVNLPSETFDLASVRSVWARRLSVVLSLQEEHAEQSASFQIWKGEWNRHLYWIFDELRDAYWLNPIVSGGQADNKRRQMRLAKQIGLSVPATIAGNDRAALMDFTERHEEVAIKFLSQSIVRDERGFLGLYVNKITVDELKEFSPNGEQPVVLQRYVQKAFEVRYTVVGDQHFVCRIDSQKSEKTKVDWRRYDIARTPHLAINPPEVIRDAVALLVRVLEIDYAALDFAVDSDGTWWFLEVNANGQWLWIEELGGFDISGAIARLLSERNGANHGDVR